LYFSVLLFSVEESFLSFDSEIFVKKNYLQYLFNKSLSSALICPSTFLLSENQFFFHVEKIASRYGRHSLIVTVRQEIVIELEMETRRWMTTLFTSFLAIFSFQNGSERKLKRNVKQIEIKNSQNGTQQSIRIHIHSQKEFTRFRQGQL
jgi:hypothetical protein